MVLHGRACGPIRYGVSSTSCSASSEYLLLSVPANHVLLTLAVTAGPHIPRSALAVLRRILGGNSMVSSASVFYFYTDQNANLTSPSDVHISTLRSIASDVQSPPNSHVPLSTLGSSVRLSNRRNGGLLAGLHLEECQDRRRRRIRSQHSLPTRLRRVSRSPVPILVAHTS